MTLSLFIQMQLIFIAGLAVYQLFMRTGTPLQWRRFFLLVLPVFSIAVPMAFTRIVPTAMYVMPTMFIEQNLAASGLVSPESNDQTPWLFIGYGTVVMGLFGVMVIRFIRQLRIQRNYPVTREQGYYLSEHAAIATPYSFFRHIYLPVNLSQQQRAFILKHEMAHVFQWHSIDVVYSLCIRTLFWINPASWLLVRELKLVHECLADASAATSATEDYAHLLIAEQFGVTAFTFQHTFYQPSFLKQRLMQLSSPQPRHMVVRLMFSVMSLCAVGIMTTQAQTSTKETATTGTEVQPTFPGGTEALMQFLVKEIKYPESAQKSKTMGTVYVGFTVKENGKVTNVKIIKGVEASLDAEATRVINAMPDWTPGTKDNKPAAFEMTLPIRFAL